MATFSNAALVERLADRADASVHHVRRRDDVGAGRRVRDGGAHELLDRRIVRDLVVDDDAAVAVVGVLAEADVGDHEDVGTLALDARGPPTAPAPRDRRPPIRCRPSGRAARTAARCGCRRPCAAAASRTASSTDRLNTPGIDDTSRRTPFALADEQRQDEHVGRQPRLAHHRPHRLGRPQPPQPARQLQRRLDGVKSGVHCVL